MKLQIVENCDAYVYHYTKAETARDFILKNRTLRLGRYDKTNDPKESKTWQFDIGTNENRDLTKYNPASFSQTTSDKLKANAKLACFTRDDPFKDSFILDLFKRGFCRPRMWDQYADEHQGVCIVFDKMKLDQAIRTSAQKGSTVVCDNVQYRDPPVLRSIGAADPFHINIDAFEDLGEEEYAKLHLRRFGTQLFFEKMLDWRDEKELRWVVLGDESDNLFVPIHDSLIGVMFGDRTPEKVIQDTMDVAEPLGIDFMGLKWKNGGPFYDGGNLRYMIGLKGSSWERFVKRIP
jgi:Protein of unknown function (DUF2971)